MTNLLSQPQPKQIVLNDGNTYLLSPLNLNVIADLEEAFDCNIDDVMKKISSNVKFSTWRTFLYVLLKQNHPDMTLRKTGELVSTKMIKDVTSQVLDIMLGESSA